MNGLSFPGAFETNVVARINPEWVQEVSSTEAHSRILQWNTDGAENVSPPSSLGGLAVVCSGKIWSGLDYIHHRYHRSIVNLACGDSARATTTDQLLDAIHWQRAEGDEAGEYLEQRSRDTALHAANELWLIPTEALDVLVEVELAETGDPAGFQHIR